MKKISRRNFLLASGAVTIGAALAACGGSSASTSTASSAPASSASCVRKIASLVQFDPLPAITGIRCFAKSTAALMTLLCSSIVSVELSPVVPAMMIASVP